MRTNGAAGRWAGATLAMALGITPADGVAQDGDGSLTREDEIRLAMSAAPTAVSQAADVWVLGRKGFVKAVEGTNGFACLVVRGPEPAILAPHCLNPVAVETVLPAMLMEGELQQGGLSAQEVRAAVNQAFETGELALPSGPAYAYMMSKGQRLGAAGNWKPHVMLYMPYVTNADVGGDPAHPEFPFVGPVEGDPLSTLVVVAQEFVDPADVVVRR